jgi:hypothetical protein
MEFKPHDCQHNVASLIVYSEGGRKDVKNILIFEHWNELIV